MKVNPRWRVVQFPHPWGHTSGNHLFTLFWKYQTLVCSHPNTLSFRINLTLIVSTTAASPVSCMLWALRFWTEKCHMLDSTITALLTIQHNPLYRTLILVEHLFGTWTTIYPTTQLAEEWSCFRFKRKKSFVEVLKDLKMDFFYKFQRRRLLPKLWCW